MAAAPLFDVVLHVGILRPGQRRLRETTNARGASVQRNGLWDWGRSFLCWIHPVRRTKQSPVTSGGRPALDRRNHGGLGWAQQPDSARDVAASVLDSAVSPWSSRSGLLSWRHPISHSVVSPCTPRGYDLLVSGSDSSGGAFWWATVWVDLGSSRWCRTAARLAVAFSD